MAGYLEVELKFVSGRILNPRLQLYLVFRSLDFPQRKEADFVVLERREKGDLGVREFAAPPGLAARLAEARPADRRIAGLVDTSDTCAFTRLEISDGTTRFGLELDMMSAGFEGPDAAEWRTWFRVLLDGAGVTNESARRRLT